VGQKPRTYGWFPERQDPSHSLNGQKNPPAQHSLHAHGFRSTEIIGFISQKISAMLFDWLFSNKISNIRFGDLLVSV
jgi:hypothetical protein